MSMERIFFSNDRFLMIRSMWSDTGSYVYESKGDIVKSRNLDAYNFYGPPPVGTGTGTRKIQTG